MRHSSLKYLSDNSYFYHRHHYLYADVNSFRIAHNVFETSLPNNILNEYRNSAGNLHKEDGPARIYKDGSEEWWWNGTKHRTNGPSDLIHHDGGVTVLWYHYNVLHREDGPAVHHACGRKEYWYKGVLHREDGPAIIDKDVKKWYQNGNLIYEIHKDVMDKKLPILTIEKGIKEYRVDGKLHREDGPARIFPDGTEEWYFEGKLHRLDEPAVIYKNGTHKWYLNGKLHRDKYAAVICEDGQMEWWMNGLLHREDGPAIIYADNSAEQWINGRMIYRMDNYLRNDL